MRSQPSSVKLPLAEPGPERCWLGSTCTIFPILPVGPGAGGDGGVPVGPRGPGQTAPGAVRGGDDSNGAMFVYYYTFVPRPFDELAGIVDGHPYRWLPSSTPAGDRAEEGILVNLGTDRRLPLRKEVVILAGEPDRSPLRA